MFENLGSKTLLFFNVLGEIIGINTFIMTNSNYNHGSIGIGFAIPINQAMRIVEDLIATGSVVLVIDSEIF